MSNNTINKIISVIIALLLWVFVIGEVNPTTQSTLSAIPVSLLNQESLTSKGLAVAGDGDYNIDLLLEGQRADITKITQEDVVVTADLFGYGKGQSYLEVSVKVPSTVTKVEARPARILVTIEDLVAVSKPVRLEVSGLEKGTTEIGDITLKPDEIEVSGAKSQVAAVDHIQVVADGAKILENGSTLQLEAIPVNSAGVIVRNVELSSEYVELKAKKYEVKEVKLNIQTEGTPAEGYALLNVAAPDTIRIKGPKSVLKNISSLSMEPLNIEGLSANATRDVALKLPDKVELADANKIIRAEVTLKTVASREFTFDSSEVTLKDVPQGFSAAASGEPVVVKVYGEEVVLDSMTKSDIVLEASLAQATEDTASAAVTANSSRTLSGITVKPQAISVKINEEI